MNLVIRSLGPGAGNRMGSPGAAEWPIPPSLTPHTLQRIKISLIDT